MQHVIIFTFFGQITEFNNTHLFSTLLFKPQLNHDVVKLSQNPDCVGTSPNGPNNKEH